MLQSLAHQAGSVIATTADLLNAQGGLSVLVLIFLSVFCATLGLAGIANTNPALNRRLTAQGRAQKGGESEHTDGRLAILFERFQRVAERAFDRNSDESARLRIRLSQAGYYARTATGAYYAWKLMLALVLPTLFLFLSPLFTNVLDTDTIIWTALALATFGFFAPVLHVWMRIRSRQQAAREAFPDSLDLLLVCVEAGLSLDAAISRVGKEIARAHPILAEHFAIASLELRAGKSRKDALRSLARRIGIQEVAALVTLLIQSDSLGTSIADALRVHAQEMRDKRTLRAEEKAHKLPVKMAIPLVCLILPALLIVILAPSIIDIIEQLLPIFNSTDFGIVSKIIR